MNIQKVNSSELQLFELSENPLIRQRQLILQEVGENLKLNTIEKSIAEATIKPIVKDMPDKYLIDQLNILIPNICRDLGIKNWNNPTEMQHAKTRFFQMIRRYYPNLTIQSIKIAFELLAVGQLDDFLPKDKNGNPDKNHYQEFSFEFYTRILNAYVKKTSEVWSKAKLCLPKKEHQYSDEEIKTSHNICIDEIWKSFEDYKTNKTEPNFILEVNLNILIEKGLVEKAEASTQSVDKAYNRLLIDKYISKLAKKEMIDNWERKKQTHSLKMEAQRIENNNTIKAFFDKLIQEEKDIKQGLTKIN